MCIDPLDPEQHPRDGLVNIVTGEVVYHPSANADQAVALGKQQCEEFEAGWSDSFFDTISRVVNPMSVSSKFIDVGHSKVFDTEMLYARAMGLQSSQWENAVLWTVGWPASGSVQDFLDAFRAHLLIYLRKLVIWLHAIDPDPPNLEP